MLLSSLHFYSIFYFQDFVLGEGSSNFFNDSISSAFYLCDNVAKNFFKEVKPSQQLTPLNREQRNYFIKCFSSMIRADFQLRTRPNLIKQFALTQSPSTLNSKSKKLRKNAKSNKVMEIHCHWRYFLI